MQVTGPGPVYVSTSADRMDNPPRGYLGGAAGQGAALWKNVDEFLPAKARSTLKSGDIVTLRTPGGGGYGPPQERALEAIRFDTQRGYLTPAATNRDYPQSRS